MRFATVKIRGGGEIVAVVLDVDWPTDLLSLLEEGRTGDLRS